LRGVDDGVVAGRISEGIVPMKDSVKIAIIVFCVVVVVAILVHAFGANPLYGALAILVAAGVYGFQKFINE
jgi:hypothetical protein